MHSSRRPGPLPLLRTKGRDPSATAAAPRRVRAGLLLRSAGLGVALAAMLGPSVAAAAPTPPTCAVVGPQPTVFREAPAPPDDITAGGLIPISCTGASPVTIVIDQAPHDGFATSGGPGLVRYAISHGGYVGTDTFVVHGSNADGDSAPVTVDVDVTKAPEPGPSCPEQFGSVPQVRSGEQRPLSLPCPGAVGGQIVAASAHGTAGTPVAGGDGVVRVPYTADAGYTGGDYVLVSALGADGQASDPKVLPVVVVDPSTNTAPLCPSPMVPEYRQPFTGPIEFATECIDREGDPLSYTVTAQPGHGTASVGSTPDRLLYTPAAGYAGWDVFSYVVSDGHGGSTANSAMFSVDTSIPGGALPMPLPAPRVLKPVLAYKSSSLKATKHTIPIKIACRTAACSGTISLTQQTTIKTKHAHKSTTHKTITIARSTYHLAANTTATVALRLTKAGKKAVAHANKSHPVKKLTLTGSTKGGTVARATVKVV
jgi:hypothetical protein